MNDDEVVQLLREIRDLQQQHVLNYKDALANQQKSIALQQSQARWARILLLCLVGLLALFVVLLMLPHK